MDAFEGINRESKKKSSLSLTTLDDDHSCFSNNYQTFSCTYKKNFAHFANFELMIKSDSFLKHIFESGNMEIRDTVLVN